MALGLLRRNSFEDVPNATTITTGNSAGAAADGFNNVSITGTGTGQGDTSGGLVGSRSLRITTPATTDVVRLDWSGLNDASGAARYAFKLNALPSLLTFIVRVLDVNTTQILTVAISSANKLQVLNGAGSVVKTFANTLTTGQWYTVEALAIPGNTTSNGTALVSYFLGTATSTPVGETQYSAVGTANTGILHIGEVRFGKATGAGTFDGWADIPAYLPGANALLGPPPDLVSVPAPAAVASGTFVLPTVAGILTISTSGPASGIGSFPVPTVIGATAPPQLTVTVEADNLPPRVRLEITTPGSPAVYVNRTDARGIVTPVRGGDPAATTGSFTLLYDYEMPYNQPVIYTADLQVSAPVTVPVTQSWLVHPGVPDLSQPVIALLPSDEERPSSAGVHEIIGRAAPIIVTDGRRKSPRFALSLFTDTEAQQAGLDDLFYDESPLLLQIVDPAFTRQVYRWVSVGSASMGFPGDFSNDARVWSLPCIEVDRPVGNVQAQRTWADVLTEADDWAELAGTYATWRGVLTGIASS